MLVQVYFGICTVSLHSLQSGHIGIRTLAQQTLHPGSRIHATLVVNVCIKKLQLAKYRKTIDTVDV